jgi:hypothetical protein
VPPGIAVGRRHWGRNWGHLICSHASIGAGVKTGVRCIPYSHLQPQWQGSRTYSANAPKDRLVIIFSETAPT